MILLWARQCSADRFPSEAAVKDGRQLASVPAANNLPELPRLDEAAYEALKADKSPEGKKALADYIKPRAERYNKNKQMEAERFKLYRMLDLSQQLATIQTGHRVAPW